MLIAFMIVILNFLYYDSNSHNFLYDNILLFQFVFNLLQVLLIILQTPSKFSLSSEPYSLKARPPPLTEGVSGPGLEHL